MNDAGRSVGPARGAFKLPLERVLVVHDEIDLPFGEVRTRIGGGLAGHNGLKSIKRELGGADFMRVRVGVGRPDSTDPEIVSGVGAGALPRGRCGGRELDRARLRARSERRRARPSRAGRSRADAGTAPALRTLLGLVAARTSRRCGWRARAATRSCRRRCAPTWSRRWLRSTTRAQRGRRWWWSATIAPRATWRPTCARGSRRGACATTRRAASPTSPTSRRRRTWSGCAWPRSTRCSAPSVRRRRPARTSRRWWS